jgi:hypothetical protein
MRRASLHFVVRPRMTRQVLPCVSALACGAETPFFILSPYFLLTKETVR